VDALSEVLKALRLTTGIFLDAEFTAPWCINSSPGSKDDRCLLPRVEQVSIFHVLTEGRCLAKLGAAPEVVDIQRGDLIMFPRCDAHLMGSDVKRAPVRMEALLRPVDDGQLPQVSHGGGGERTRFVCGYVACDKRLCRPLLGALPAMVQVSLGAGEEGAWLIESLRRGADECRSRTPGGEAVLSKLAELSFSSRRSGAMCVLCLPISAVGSPVCAIPRSDVRWPCCTLTQGGPGPSTNWRARPPLRVPLSASASP